jgi:hypothetical protein
MIGSSKMSMSQGRYENRGVLYRAVSDHSRYHYMRCGWERGSSISMFFHSNDVYYGELR